MGEGVRRGASFLRLFQVLVEPVGEDCQVLSDRGPPVVRTLADNELPRHAFRLELIHEYLGLPDWNEFVFIAVDDERWSAFFCDVVDRRDAPQGGRNRLRVSNDAGNSRFLVRFRKCEGRLEWVSDRAVVQLVPFARPIQKVGWWEET